MTITPIPTLGGASLSMSHAASIVLAEAMRQRMGRRGETPLESPGDGGEIDVDQVEQ